MCCSCHRLVYQILKLLQLSVRGGQNLRLQWMPSHCGIPENETDDQCTTAAYACRIVCETPYSNADRSFIVRYVAIEYSAPLCGQEQTATTITYILWTHTGEYIRLRISGLRGIPLFFSFSSDQDAETWCHMMELSFISTRSTRRNIFWAVNRFSVH